MKRVTADKEKIWVITNEPLEEVRGGEEGLQARQLDVKKLSSSINLFLEQMDSMLEKAPMKLGNFHFDEFEVYAQVDAEGTLGILGTSVKAGAMGGLKFVFRRSSVSDDGK